ncbi:MAG: hypothetical protein MJZ28_07535 [Paludibacteraceae bacterium]|nr:hypothetical protein [Bacilli bacterium]MCQ2194787.1 hypothetical protein [Paludibacteraceae bacterium]
MLTLEEMEKIEEMEAAWTAELQQKVNVITRSLSNDFAFAFGPMYDIKKISEVPAEDRLVIHSKIKKYLESANGINTYENDFDVLDGINMVAIDYSKLSDMKQYDTVSYCLGQDVDDSLVLAYKLKI